MFATTELFGKIHTRKAPKLAAVAPHWRRAPLHQLETLTADWIPESLLAPAASQANSRQRVFTPKLTTLAFLSQVLNPGRSCLGALRQIQAYYQLQDHPPAIADNTSAFCQARGRLELTRLQDIRRHLAERAETTVARPWGRPVKLLDGTCLSMPDTPENQLAYPQSDRQKPGCGFPLLRVVNCFSLDSGAVLDAASGPYTTSELALYRFLEANLEPEDIVVADRLFASFGTLAQLLAKGVAGLFRLHASRRADLRKGKRLGHQDRLQTWSKPRQCPANWTEEEWAKVPDTLTVRIVRVRIAPSNSRVQTLWLVTTLLDPKLWPKERLAALYRRRWQIEVNLDDLKTTLQMDVLSCLTPAMIQKEVEMHWIAYNLIRAVMVEAAVTCHGALDRLSFKGTLETMHEFSVTLARLPARHTQRRQRVYQAMLAAIAGAPVPLRPGRREPRCVKRRPKAYVPMTKPRRQMRDSPKRYRRKAKRS